MRVTTLQTASSATKSDNIAELRALMAQAGPSDLISLPEMWSCLGGDRARKLSQGEALPAPGDAAAPGSAYGFLREAAIALGCVVHGGSIGERVDDQLFNTSLVFGPDGRELGRYRKIHLFDIVTPSGQGYRESSLFGAGDQVVTCAVPAPGGTLRLGLSICYDLRFGELFLALRRAGAEVIMVPAAFTVETGRDHWEVLLRARAIETQCFVIAAATTGTHQDAAGRPRATYGHSLICDPWGRVCSIMGTEPGVASAVLELSLLAKLRADMPVLDHRRLV